MFSDDRIRDCYYRMLAARAEKQKESIDRKALEYKQELDRKAMVYKRQVEEDARRQFVLIDKNTQNFKVQVEAEAEGGTGVFSRVGVDLRSAACSSTFSRGVS